MIFSFKDILSHIEQTLINSIKELKKNKKAIRPETSLYLFGLAISSFFEDSVADININDKRIQARFLDSFRLGFKDGITGNMQSQQQVPTDVPQQGGMPPEQPGVPVPGGAPVGPDQLGTLPMPTGGGVPPAPQGGEPQNLENPEQEPPQPLKKPTEKFDFKTIKQGFLEGNKFKGVNLKI